MTILAEALKLYDAGWDVIPIVPGGKRPLGKWGGRQREKRLSRDEVLATWGVEQPPDLGICLGKHEAAIDLDSRELVEKLAPTLTNATLCSLTPRGGLHALFRTDEETEPFRPADKVDVQGFGAVIVVPPSKDRAWTGASEVAKIPNIEVYVDGLLEGAKIPRSFRERLAAGDMRPIPKDVRNTTLARIAGLLRKAGFGESRIFAALMGLNRYATESPLPEKEVRDIAHSMGTRKQEEPFELGGVKIIEVDPTKKPPPLEVLVERFLPAEGLSLVYGGPGQGKTYLVMRLMCAVLLGIDFLGLKARKRGVLYVDWEHRGRMFQRRFWAMAKSLGVPVKDIPHPVYMTPTASLLDTIDIIEEQIATRDIGLVIVDSLSIALIGAELERAHEVGPALFRLNQLPTCVIALDHQAKLGGKDDNYWWKTPFGAAIKSWVFSNVWQIGKPKQGSFEEDTFAKDHMLVRLMHKKTNFDRQYGPYMARIEFLFAEGEDSPARVTIDCEERYTSEEQIQLELENARQEERGPMTCKELSEEVGLSESRVFHLLKSLVDKDVVVNVGGKGKVGRYMLQEDEK